MDLELAVETYREHVIAGIAKQKIDYREDEIDALIKSISESVKIISVVYKNSDELNSVLTKLTKELESYFDKLTKILDYLKTSTMTIVKEWFASNELKYRQYAFLLEHNTKCNYCKNEGFIWVPDEHSCSSSDPNGHAYDDMHREKCPKCKGTLQVPSGTYLLDVDEILESSLRANNNRVKILWGKIDKSRTETATILTNLSCEG